MSKGIGDKFRKLRKFFFTNGSGTVSQEEKRRDETVLRCTFRPRCRQCIDIGCLNKQIEMEGYCKGTSSSDEKRKKPHAVGMVQ